MEPFFRTVLCQQIVLVNLKWFMYFERSLEMFSMCCTVWSSLKGFECFFVYSCSKNKESKMYHMVFFVSLIKVKWRAQPIKTSESTFCFMYWCLCLNNYLEIILHWIALQISVSLVPLALSCSVHVANLAKDENFHINTCSLCVTFNRFRKFVCIFPSIFAWTFLHAYFSGFSCVNCVQYGRFKCKKNV